MPNTKTFAIAGTAAAVVVAGVAVAAVAHSKLAGSDASDLAAVVPANSVAFVSVNLDPKASQKLKFNNLLKRVDKNGGDMLGDFKASDVSIPTLLDEGFKDCNTAERKWVGDGLGVAVMPAKAGEDPNVLAYVSSKDDDSAKKFIADIKKSKSKDCDTPSASLVDGWVVLGSEKGSTEALSKDGFKSLETNKEFTSDIKAMKDQGLLTYWVDVNAPYIVKSAGESGKELKDINSAYGTIRALDNSFESYNHISAPTKVKPVGSAADIIKAIPSGSTGAVAMAGVSNLSEVLNDPLVASRVSDLPVGAIANLLASPIGVGLSDVSGEPKGAVYTAAPVEVVKKAALDISEAMGASANVFSAKMVGETIREITFPGQVEAPAGPGSITETQGFKDSVGDYSKSVALLYISGELLEDAGIGGVFTGAGLNAAQSDGGFDVTLRVGISQ